MVIKASASGEIRQLIAALDDADQVRREAAIARLSVIGERAVDRLASAFDSASSDTARAGVLRALEGVQDPRLLPLARKAIAAGGELAGLGVGVLGTLLASNHEATATRALDALITLALDPAGDRSLRMAALDAMRDEPGDVVGRVAQALGADAVSGTGAPGSRAPSAAADAWQLAISGTRPPDPGTLRAAIPLHAPGAALNALQRLVDAVRGWEEAARADTAAHARWIVLRGALHQALARRGSRVALYDLRETFERAHGPLPVAFLAALYEVGDHSCLEPIAQAWSAASPEETWWRQQLGEAFRAIARRDKVTRRSAMMKRMAIRWPEAIDALLQ